MSHRVHLVFAAFALAFAAQANAKLVCDDGTAPSESGGDWACPGHETPHSAGGTFGGGTGSATPIYAGGGLQGHHKARVGKKPHKAVSSSDARPQ